jgi:preprotein translocase subunit SecF
MLNLVAKRNWFYLVSFILVIPGAISLLIPPRLQPGIEFTSGTTFSFRYAQPTSSEDVKSLISDLGHSEARVQRTGENQFLVQTKEIEGSATTPPVGPALPSEREAIEAALTGNGGSRPRAPDQSSRSFPPYPPPSKDRPKRRARGAARFGLHHGLHHAFRNVLIRCATACPDRSPLRRAARRRHLLHPGQGVDVEVNTFFTGILTVVGFSVHDPIG